MPSKLLTISIPRSLMCLIRRYSCNGGHCVIADGLRLASAIFKANVSSLEIEKREEFRMARTAKKIVKRTTKKSQRKSRKQSSPNNSVGDQNTLSVLDGEMKNAFREAFLRRQ